MGRREKINRLILRLEKERKNNSDFPIMYIIKALKIMGDILSKKNINYDVSRKEAAGTGKGIMDDDKFARGPIGNDVMELIEEILKLKKVNNE